MAENTRRDRDGVTLHQSDDEPTLLRAGCAPWCTDHRRRVRGGAVWDCCHTQLTPPGVSVVVAVSQWWGRDGVRLDRPYVSISAGLALNGVNGHPATLSPVVIPPEQLAVLHAALDRAAQISDAEPSSRG